MATKKECDRCGKQWEHKPTFGRETDPNLGVATFTAPPDRSNYRFRDTISATLEMCQPCIRDVHTYATQAPAKPDRRGESVADLMKGCTS